MSSNLKIEHFLGGIASMGATCCTHPLDTIKVLLQTQKKVKHGMIGVAIEAAKTNGILSLYNGMSAALLRQATYSTVRFAFYETAKDHILSSKNQSNSNKIQKLTFSQSIVIAGIGGGLGSIFGSPADLINVRMQNDLKLPLNERRNYKHCFEALSRIARTEGLSALYIGFHMATLRGILVTIGQLAFYDQFKTALLNTKKFKDNIITHFTASMLAGLVATTITQPADVIKTLLMNAKKGEHTGIVDTIRQVLKHDKLGLFKGFWPRFIRLGPFTILSFIFYEKLKSTSNYLQNNQKTKPL